ncbi:hypothetical protein QF027_008057 [Streptomyces canus]|nr:hypothetical protein [Streptomyces canus]
MASCSGVIGREPATMNNHIALMNLKSGSFGPDRGS